MVISFRTEPTQCWQIRGNHHTKIIRSPCGRKHINILGALDLQLRIFTTWLTEGRCDSYLICHFLDDVKRTYRWSRKELYMVLDNAKYNLAYETQDYAREI